MALAVRKLLMPAAEHQPPPVFDPPDQDLHISVIATSLEATAAALKKASDLASRLGANIALIVPQVVPFPLPLASPPVLVGFNENRYRAIVQENSVQTSVRIYLCRDRLETVRSALKPRSLVVLGGRKRWWPTAEKRLASKLRKDGHEVIVIDMEYANAGLVLCGYRLRISARLLGFYQGLRQALGDCFMDYAIAGVASLGLFLYLIYALLRPEKF